MAGLPDCWGQFRVRDRGQAGLAAVRLALVTVLQRAEKLTGRLAAGAVRMRLDWKYLLGLAVDDPGFDHAVLAEFRGKVAGAGLERGALRLDAFWLGHKLHVTGTCHAEPRCGCPGDDQAGRRGHEEGCAAAAFPNLITRVAAAGATVTGSQMTAAIDDELARKTRAPGRHCLRFIGRRVVPQFYLADLPVPRERAKKPYSSAQIAGFLALTDAQLCEKEFYNWSVNWVLAGRVRGWRPSLSFPNLAATTSADNVCREWPLRELRV